MQDEIEVDVAEMEVANAPTRLISLGIGSCIVITLYDPALRIGALAHTMLPDSTKCSQSNNPFKYADLAVVEMIKRLEGMGCRKQDLEANLIGRANMFPHIPTLGVKETGEEDCMAVKKKLREEGIELTGEAIGGNSGRSVEFDTSTGTVTIKKIKI